MGLSPTNTNREILNAFTVDVEDYFQVSAFEKYVPRAQWDCCESRVEANTHHLLRLLDEHGVKATFFVLGWIGERYPNLVRDIHACGHEIASHGYWHRLIHEQTPEEFRADLRRSRDGLQDVIGEPVTAYRAASFSITERSLWALEIIVEEGFLVDSSVFPIRHDRYGMPSAPRTIHRISTPSGPLWECPLSVVKCACFRLPVGGGGYLRLYPINWTCRCLKRINRREQRPFVVYVHPWEIDGEQPRIRGPSWLTYFRHYVNLSQTARKIEALLRRFRFGPLRDVVDHRPNGLDTAVAAPAAASGGGQDPHVAAL